MARRALLLLAAVGALSILPTPGATAGGACFRPASESDGTTTVRMIRACFTPSVLRVDPGTTVSFVNEDEFIHNLSSPGLPWELDDLREGQGLEVTFDRAGIFPFACTYHPGMSGAIVVGSGDPDDAGPVLAGWTALGIGAMGGVALSALAVALARRRLR